MVLQRPVERAHGRSEALPMLATATRRATTKDLARLKRLLEG
ncbi:MAG: hypothetical protein WAW88_14535 [Nocardioides sp.]